ncbi:hypothetical protein VKT23_019487 [Stygiomarasmius scandens]|uniref:Uncharacterized protein n=1 Tax=Marasmiellus scandens TaxID=2682957 RepID=A0ABR1ILC3_9AGAR
MQLHDTITSQSDLASILTCSSEFYTITSGSGSTIPGPGALSGKLVKALGRLVLRTSDDVAIWMRLTSIRIRRSSVLLGRVWDDLLEFSRRDIYSTSIRRRSLEFLLNAIQDDLYIRSNHEDSLVSRLMKLPQTEIEMFVVQMVSCLPDERLYHFKREPVHAEVRNRFGHASSTSKRQITARFAGFLDTLLSRAQDVGMKISTDFDRLVLNLTRPDVFLGDSYSLERLAIGGPMWIELGSFLALCSPDDALQAWSEMTEVIIQPSSWSFFEYKERVHQYRDVDPTLFFVEFCSVHCPSSIDRFCGVGLHSFLLAIINDLLPGAGARSLQKSNIEDQRKALIDAVTQLTNRIAYNGYGDIELEQQYISSVVFIALLATSLIYNCNDDTTKTSYQSCVRHMLIAVRNDNIEVWEAYVSYRTVFGAGVELDPNILLALFKILERVYNVHTFT